MGAVTFNTMRGGAFPKIMEEIVGVFKDVRVWDPPAAGSADRDEMPVRAFLDQKNRRYPFMYENSEGEWVVSYKGLMAARARAAQQGDAAIFREATRRLNVLRAERGEEPLENEIGKSREFHVIKSDKDKRLVFGWASIAVRVDGEVLEDHHEDIIDIEELEQAAYRYVVNFGSAGEMHEREGVGVLVESIVFTKEKSAALGIPQGYMPQGWWVGFRIDDSDVWEKVKSGVYPMFSIGGTAQRVDA